MERVISEGTPASSVARSGRLYYGWIVAAALAVLSSANVSASYTFGLSLVPISTQLALDRASLALAVTAYTFLAGLFQPIAGYVADRVGPRQVGAAGAAILGLGLVLLSFAESLPAIYLSYGVVSGLGAALISGGVTARIVSAWFIRRRGTAMALAGGGAIIAQTLIVPAAALVLAQSDWQTAERMVGGLILLIVAPTVWILARNDPAEKGLYPDGALAQPKLDVRETGGLTLRQAVRYPAYWQLGFGLIACGVTMSFPSTHLAAFADDMGMPGMAASETIGLAGILSLPGAMILAFFGDRTHRHRMLAVAYGLRAVTYLILLQAHSPTIMLAAGVTLGLSWGATVPLTSAIVADLFGRRQIATLVTTLTMLMFLASGIFSYLAGLDYSLLGSYQVSLLAAAILSIIAVINCWWLRRPMVKSF